MSTDRPDRQRRRRVVVAYGTSSREPAALEAAAQLAARIDTELAGVFFEDLDLLTMADLPVTSLLSYSGAERAALDPALMRRSFRVQAERFRHRLAMLSESRNLAWSLEIRQGRVAETVLAGETEEDWVVLGTSESATHSQSQRPSVLQSSAILLVRHRMREPHHVAVLYEDAGETLALGESLALHLRAPLTVIPLAMSGTDEAARMRQLQSWADERKSFARIAEPCGPGLRDVLAAVAGVKADLIVIARDGCLRTGMGLRRLESALDGGALIIAGTNPPQERTRAPDG